VGVALPKSRPPVQLAIGAGAGRQAGRRFEAFSVVWCVQVPQQQCRHEYDTVAYIGHVPVKLIGVCQCELCFLRDCAPLRPPLRYWLFTPGPQWRSRGIPRIWQGFSSASKLSTEPGANPQTSLLNPPVLIPCNERSRPDHRPERPQRRHRHRAQQQMLGAIQQAREGAAVVGARRRDGARSHRHLWREKLQLESGRRVGISRPPLPCRLFTQVRGPEASLKRGLR
jgi:hypothetical protein